MSDDLNFQNISTVQNNLQPTPVTIAAATTIAPTTFVTFITGTTAITTITPPVTGSHMLALIFAATNATLTGSTVTNGIKSDLVPGSFAPVFLVYDPTTKLYYAR